MAVTKIRAGKAVYVPWEVTSGHPPAAYDPPSAPVVSIADPNGVVRVNAQATTRAAAGIYYFIYTTPADGALGVWQGWLDAVDGAGVPSGSLKAPAFELV
jgi:hypothetical protein